MLEWVKYQIKVEWSAAQLVPKSLNIFYIFFSDCTTRHSGMLVLNLSFYIWFNNTNIGKFLLFLFLFLLLLTEALLITYIDEHILP